MFGPHYLGVMQPFFCVYLLTSFPFLTSSTTYYMEAIHSIHTYQNSELLAPVVCFKLIYGQFGQSTGKSVSEALILESINPKYDERLLLNYKKIQVQNMLCTNIVLNFKTKKNNFCTQFVLNLYFSGEFYEQSLFILLVN